jgi:hypothetical protein
MNEESLPNTVKKPDGKYSSEDIFWKGDYKGAAEGGYFVRCDLAFFLQRLVCNGLEPVGLKIDGLTVEVIVKTKPEMEE